MDNKELTRAEEQIMQILWEIRKGFIKDVILHMPKPKPAYSTVSTIMRILVTKGFVGYKAYGKTHEYFPLIDRETYKGYTTEKLLNNYFGNSVENFILFFVDKKNMNAREADEIIRLLKNFKKDNL